MFSILMHQYFNITIILMVGFFLQLQNHNTSFVIHCFILLVVILPNCHLSYLFQFISLFNEMKIHL